MRRWSLRTKLVVVAALGLFPILLISAWHSHRRQADTVTLRETSLAWAADLAISRQRELIEGSTRLLTAACDDEVVRRSTSTGATSTDIQRCNAYVGGLLGRFPGDYSAILVTDEQGVTRCASAESGIGVNLGDREIFRQVRSYKGLSVGTSVASRVTPRTIIPIAMPVYVDDNFRGMCAIGVALKSFGDSVTAMTPGGGINLSLVDATGAPIGGNAEASLALPIAKRVAGAIAAGQRSLIDYGQNGALYDYRILPLTNEAVFIVAGAPVAQGLLPLWRDWSEFGLILIAGAVLLLSIWLGADRWCMRPLRYLDQAAGRIARGEATRIEPQSTWGTETLSVATGIEAMASALAAREAELKSGLEQRDHMLREIHHRVKNNLQMISSLLNLQAGEIRSPRIRRYFGDAQNRVLTLSILHRHLYERSSWSLVDFQQFISDLVRQISVGRTGLDRPTPRFHIRAPIMAVGPDTAIPVGLIVTEAVSNALNHDFTGVTGPEIRIEATEGPDHNVELVIEDNGRRTGREVIGPDSRGGFGLTLVRGLAMQLGGEVVVSSVADGRTRVTVAFPMAEELEAHA